MIGEMPSTNRRDGGGECENDFGPLALSTDPLYDYVWIDPGRGREMAQLQVTATEPPVTIEIPGDLDHRILHLHR